MDPAWVSGACVSRQRVAGAGRGSLASGCGGYEEREERLRTRAQRGRTWWKSYSRSDFDLIDFKGGRNYDEAQVQSAIPRVDLGSLFFFERRLHGSKTNYSSLCRCHQLPGLD